ALPEEAAMLLLSVEARIACRALGVQKAEVRENLLVLTFSDEHLPARDDLTQMASRVRLPYRFVTSSGEPLQFSVTLNPPRRGDPAVLTRTAADVLTVMTGASERKVGAPSCNRPASWWCHPQLGIFVP